MFSNGIIKKTSPVLARLAYNWESSKGCWEGSWCLSWA